MGSDDENWVPKQVKSKIKQNDQYDPKPVKPLINNTIISNDNNNNLNINDQNLNKLVNSYQVTLNGDKRNIKASNLEDILQNIKIKYGLNNNQRIRVNYWLDHQWLFLDTFPPDNTKLQVILMDQNEPKNFLQEIKCEQDLNAIIRNEIIKYLEQPLNISKHMNQAFKYSIDANKQQDYLNYYETSVHYITKRYNQNHASPTKQLLHLQEKQQQLIDKLIEETEVLKNENKRLKQQLDEIKTDLESVVTNVKPNKKSTKTTRCSIM